MRRDVAVRRSVTQSQRVMACARQCHTRQVYSEVERCGMVRGVMPGDARSAALIKGRWHMPTRGNGARNNALAWRATTHACCWYSAPGKRRRVCSLCATVRGRQARTRGEAKDRRAHASGQLRTICRRHAAARVQFKAARARRTAQRRHRVR